MMIRAAHADDAEFVLQVWNGVIRDTVITFTTIEKTLEDVQALIAGQLFLIAEADGEVLGFATCGAFRSGPGYKDAAEHSIYLTRAAQGRGIGAGLLGALEDQARAAGLCHLVAAITGSNETARKFHTRAGFAQVGEMKGIGQKFGSRHDLVFMMKKL